MNTNKVDYSIILAAGKGTRFYSKLPKVLHKISGRTLLENSIRAVSPHVTKEILIVAGHGLELVKAEIQRIQSANPNLNIRVIHQEQQIGTGHATKVAIDAIEDVSASTIIIPGDCPLIKSSALEQFVSEEFNTPLAVLTLNVNNPFGFGRILRDESGFLVGIVEEKDATDKERQITEINSSIFLGRVELFKKYLPLLSNSNKQGEYYLTDIVYSVVKENINVKAFVSQDTESFLGANSRRELYLLQEKKRVRDLDALMDRGVTLESVATVFIDDAVEIGKDVFIGSNTRILGNTKIADGVIIEGDTLIRNSEIGQNVHLKLGAYVDECRIDEDSTLGPFVQIRPKSHLKKGVKIGNFVEVKASVLEAGVKANHLAYLGDIDIGQNSNIGAGTIICNYDGKNKFRSKVGKDSFVGSNSTLVSPVEVGDNAYVAAGSVVTQNVESNALAIGRSRQVNKEGWVKKQGAR